MKYSVADGAMSLVCFALAIGAAASPFNEFLRGKYFSDRYRWRGLDQRDVAPLLKTIAMTLGFVAGGFYWIATSSGSSGMLHGLLLAVFLIGALGTALFSIAYSWWRMRHAREHRDVKPEDMTHP